MTRMPQLKREEMNEEQGAVYDEIVNRGGRIGGPYGAYIRIPRFMRLNQEMGDYLRSNGLPPKLRQLAAILAIRFWGGRYAWAANARNAVGEGLDQSIVDAINERRPPRFADDDEKAVYEVVTELLETKGISDETYDAAERRFGQEHLVNIIVTAGFFSMVCMTTNSVQVSPPDDAEQVLIV